MDNNTDKQQNEDLNKKKLILPLAIFVVGAVVVVVLIKLFVLNKSHQNDEMSELVAQDAFQAPAEMSTAVQIECQAAVEKIDRSKECGDKEKEFFSKGSSCLIYDYALENAKTLTPEGQFGDIILDIEKCYRSLNPADLTSVNRILTKALTDFSAWEIDMGPITCNSKTTLEAHLEAVQTHSKFVCHKASELDVIAQKLQQRDVAILGETVWQEHVPHYGMRDSDVYCPETVANINKNITRALNSGVKVSRLAAAEGVESGDVHYLELTRGSDSLAMIKFSANSEGCLYLDALLTSSVDTPEQ
ncbi:MAG: hypothetical protein ACK41T_02075 [Pseudobdellovibrio sp.]